MPLLNKRKSQLFAELFYCKNLTFRMSSMNEKKERVEKFAFELTIFIWQE